MDALGAVADKASHFIKAHEVSVETSHTFGDLANNPFGLVHDVPREESRVGAVLSEDRFKRRDDRCRLTDDPR